MNERVAEGASDVADMNEIAPPLAILEDQRPQSMINVWRSCKICRA
jgi:hypothetical protein